ncbi:MAG TPA: GWxTD domain-containing protein, partial [Thermoanaerobaculia bacterium]|nr:GWxTD domain-containing protein [Thermoanaerobaculia bacterium]
MRSPRARLLAIAAVTLVLLRGATALAASPAELAPKYQQFLEEAELLMSAAERAAFVALGEDYARDAFIASFWRSRDPYPETARNEARDTWQERLESGRSLFGTIHDARARFQLLNDAPDQRVEIAQRDPAAGDGFRCAGLLVPIEVWAYAHDERTHEELVVIFFRPGGVSPWRRWESYDGVGALVVTGTAQVQGPSKAEVFAVARDQCPEAAEALQAALAWIAAREPFHYPLMMIKAEAPIEPPSVEWLSTFASYSTDVPADAGTFSASVDFSFPGRRQSRTVVQGTIAVPVAELGEAALAGAHSYDLLVTGEVLHDSELLDRFRYRFDFAAGDVSGPDLPLVIQRPLRPGDYR